MGLFFVVYNYAKNNIAVLFKHAIEQCGLFNQPIGNTYMADHITNNGQVPESAIDHVYHSNGIKEKILCKTLANSSTDHLPVVTTYAMGRPITKIYTKQITKRSLKNFNEQSWNKCLVSKVWSGIEKENDINEKVRIFTNNINEALDEVAPIKNFKIKSSYKFGLSDKTKELMRIRDHTRNQIKNSTNQEKQILLIKYRKLRNSVTQQIRKDNYDHNNNRVENAKSESELWKITNEVVKPKTNRTIKLMVNGACIDDETKVAETFKY